MNYTKTNHLNTHILSCLNRLEDGDYVPFYTERMLTAYHSFHFLTENGVLVSFIGIMPVNETDVELTAYTFPPFRHQGHFTFLLENVMKELEQTCCCLIFSEEKLLFPFIKNIPSHTEYFMGLSYEECRSCPEPAAAAGSKLLEYTRQNDGETEYIYVLTQHGIALGLLKITCETDSKTACLHHVQIRRPYRQKGYGTLLVSHGLHCFWQQKNCDTVLHVTSTNTAAVHLYQKLGFRIIQSLDYYRLELQFRQ